MSFEIKSIFFIFFRGVGYMSLVYGNSLSKTPALYNRVQSQSVLSLLELPRNPAALPAPSSQHSCCQAKASKGVPLSLLSSCWMSLATLVGWGGSAGRVMARILGSPLLKDTALKAFLSTRSCLLGRVILRPCPPYSRCGLYCR